MSSYQCKVSDVIHQYADLLEDQDLIIRLKDGTCRIQKNIYDNNYKIWVDDYDLIVSSTIERFLDE
ncbi:hypothetical protein SAMN05216352_11810 [Alteribacillus bidgolensis]|uniref:Uncharacterized protein n=1 Tax=Alteribacillus bidgolensis TaxID=930129 RepID=A0A1G8Q629_9BACI|nr:hypothetical protein SAMN05216352_11810 [Alteribacillus bidgolensis]